MNIHNTAHASFAWVSTLGDIIEHGNKVSPRGMKTLEIPQHTFRMYMRYPVVLCPGRKLSYTFLAAEALWILDGDNRVDTIAPWNPNIAQFSDNGVTFFGAYGPKIAEQFDYALDKLWEDRNTRQAGMTMWRENPQKTKDVPCTVAIFFSIRFGRLQCHVFMRSSDAWLGLPYDCFNFSMLSLKMACAYNRRADLAGMNVDPIELGALYLTMASSHLYEKNFEGAKACIAQHNVPIGNPIPSEPLLKGQWGHFEDALLCCRAKTDCSIWRIRP